MVTVSFDGGFTMKCASELTTDEVVCVKMFTDQIDKNVIDKVTDWIRQHNNVLFSMCDGNTFKRALEDVDGYITIDCNKLNLTLDCNADKSNYIINKNICDYFISHNICITV